MRSWADLRNENPGLGGDLPELKSMFLRHELNRPPMLEIPADGAVTKSRPLFAPSFAAEAARDGPAIRSGWPPVWAGQGRTAPAQAAPRRSRTIIQRKAEAAGFADGRFRAEVLRY